MKGKLATDSIFRNFLHRDILEEKSSNLGWLRKDNDKHESHREKGKKKRALMVI
jgi:hypothetical protein